ncbi:MAG: fasciclin domain-containing protein [Anaerolineae bacterium]|nr:fasciclin domain-containing protein [Anaerolineae bacterium]
MRQRWGATLLLLLWVMFMFGAGMGAGQAQDSADDLPTLMDIIRDRPSLSRLEALVDALDMAALLENPAYSWTIFAPNNEGLGALLCLFGTDDMGDFLDQITPAAARRILLAHIVPGRLTWDELLSADLNSAAPYPLLTLLPGYSLTLQQARVNDSFDILRPNVAASNGVLHGIDGVIDPLPPALAAVAEVEQALAALPPAGPATLHEVLAATGQHTIFLTMAEAAGVLPLPAAGGPYTVFAPTDAAALSTLAAMGTSAEDLLANPDALREIVSYHIIPGVALYAPALPAAAHTGTLLVDRPLYLTQTPAGPRVNDIRVSGAGQGYIQGVVYPLNGLLLPPVPQG